MRNFKTMFGDTISVDCLGCSNRHSPELQGLQITETEHWYVSQDIELAYPALIILTPKRHISNYSDLNEKELQEMNGLIIKSKQNIQKLFNVDRFAYIFGEYPNRHFHFLIIPMLDFMNTKNAATILDEIGKRNKDFMNDPEHMKLVTETIDSLRKLF